MTIDDQVSEALRVIAQPAIETIHLPASMQLCAATTKSIQKFVSERTLPRLRLTTSQPTTATEDKTMSTEQTATEEQTPNDRAIYNADGSCIFKLTSPITVNRSETERVTIPALKGRHMKLCPIKGTESEIGAWVTFASQIVIPRGAVEEMSVADSLAVAVEVSNIVNKSAV